MSAALPDWLAPLPWLDLARSDDARLVERALRAGEPGIREFAVLLSLAAGRQLETLAQRALALTRRHFGQTISLYAPLYLSNYCPTRCTYCGFAADRRIARHKLTPAELEAELSALETLGIEELLLLTGDRTAVADYPYVRDCVRLAAARFPNVAVEVFAMSADEYYGLSAAGCSAVALYQETYDPVRYEQTHLSGPKRDYLNRLDAPARALAGGMRAVSLGALLGLGQPLFDLLCLYRHATHLQRTFWKGGVAISFPRLRPEAGGSTADFPVDENFLAQAIFAFRICLPDVPLTLSTRESPRFRDGMAGLGISKMSVASRTTVGGYDLETIPSGAQFDIDDQRGVAAFCAALQAKGLQPVFKNWDAAYREPTLPVSAP
ncbi:MAG: 2-iminoacetate synthase ThiH [Bryobacteraceae bacterium]